MKSLDEQKTRRVSTRMTQAQYDEIEKKAEERGMSVSAFMVDASAHNDNQINLQQLLKIQDLANHAAESLMESDP